MPFVKCTVLNVLNILTLNLPIIKRVNVLPLRTMLLLVDDTLNGFCLSKPYIKTERL